MREPYDVFVREFLQHPAWEDVLQRLEKLAGGFVNDVFVGTVQQFERNKGKAEGVYEALSLIRGLIKQSKENG